MNQLQKVLLDAAKVAAALAEAVVEAQTQPKKVYVVEEREPTLLDLFVAPEPPRRRLVVIEGQAKKKCSSYTPWQVCEDRNCFWHKDEDRRDMSKLR